MVRSAGLFWLLLLVAPLASADIFKCVAKSGLDLYQNFPCRFQSADWSTMNMALVKPQPNAPSSPLSAAARPAANTVARTPASSTSQLRLGMATEDVRALWGEPTDSYWEEPGEGDRFEVWLYGGTRSVRFVHGLVSAVRQ